MKTILTSLSAASALALTCLLPGTASAAVQTWVSNTGTDSGSCDLAAPCKTFQYAQDHTDPGGEIDVKNSGSYGTVGINKPISIVSVGTIATISVPANEFGIQVGGGGQVVLEGLTIDGHGAGSFGIAASSFTTLKISHCVVRNFRYAGIDIRGARDAQYNISDTEVTGIITGYAIRLLFDNLAKGSLTRVNLSNNYAGLYAQTNISVIDSSINNNITGVQAAPGGRVFLGHSSVSSNKDFGLNINGGAVSSYGDNYINSNGTDIAGALSSVVRR